MGGMLPAAKGTRKTTMKKTKGKGSSAKGRDTLDKLVSSCNEEAKRIQAALLSSDVVDRLQQGHSDLKAHLDGATTAASKASASMQASGQQALACSAALQRKLDEAQRSLSATSYESTLDETIRKMNAAVEQCLGGLQHKVTGKKRKVAAGKAAGGNTAKRARKVTFSTK